MALDQGPKEARNDSQTKQEGEQFLSQLHFLTFICSFCVFFSSHIARSKPLCINSVLSRILRKFSTPMQVYACASILKFALCCCIACLQKLSLVFHHPIEIVNTKYNVHICATLCNTVRTYYAGAVTYMCVAACPAVLLVHNCD